MAPKWGVTLLVVAALALGGCAGAENGALAKLERRLTFYPLRANPLKPIDANVQSVWFLVDGGVKRQSLFSSKSAHVQLKLHGILARPHFGKGDAPPRAVVLYCHGTAGNIDFVAERMRHTADKFNVLIMGFDYRGYGRSEGEPDVAGIVTDARAARDWLAARAGVPPQDVVLMGTSLGGGVATALAGQEGCRGLILEDTFTSLGDVADEHAFPGTKPSELMQARLDSIDTIKNYHGPLLHRHGDMDKLIPYEQGLRLHEAAPGPKKFVTAHGAGHNDPPTAEFEAAMEEFFAHLPPATAPQEIPSSVKTPMN